MNYEHELKTTERWFRRVEAGEKTAEIRKHDRDYQVGDRLLIVEVWGSDGKHLIETGDYEWHRKGEPTGAQVAAWIAHVLPAAHFPDGLKDGYCLLSLHLIDNDPDVTHFDERGWHPEGAAPDYCPRCIKAKETDK